MELTGVVVEITVAPSILTTNVCALDQPVPMVIVISFGLSQTVMVVALAGVDTEPASVPSI